MSEEGDLDSTEGHSQPSLGTFPLTDKDQPVSISTKGPSPQEILPPRSPSGTEGHTPIDILLKMTSEKPSDLGDDFEKGVQNSVKAQQETVNTPPFKELEQVEDNPPSPQRKESPLNPPHKITQKTHFLDSGQEKQLKHQTKTKRDIDG